MIPSQMLKGVLEGCILSFIENGECYGYEITAKLADYGFGTVAEGTIYPILLRLEKNGAIEARLKSSSAGPKRKYYHITETGTENLREFRENWAELDCAVNRVLKGAGNE